MCASNRALYYAAVGLNWAVALAWTTRTLYWLRGSRRVPDLLAEPEPNGRPSRGAAVPKLSVIVPARNEEAAIGASLDCLLESSGIKMEILAVDDRSSDTTGAVMDAAAARASGLGRELRVLHVRDLPAGWMGKTHAMALAAEKAKGDWLLFTDADVLFREDSLARAVHFAEREGADHMVLLPTAITQSFGERMAMGFLLAMSIWGAPLWKVADPNVPKAVIGIGAFNLVRREAYDSVGGWAAVRMEVIEDLAFGYLLKRAGFRSVVATGRGLVRIRWVTSLRAVVRDLGKNAFAAFRYRPTRALAALAGASAMCVFPFAALAGRAGLRIPTAFTGGSLLALYIRFRKDAGCAPAYAATFPAAACLFLWALARSTAVTLWQRGVTWRGTFYPLDELRRNMAPLR
jgi:cellulose synthase/poly-beta-1,6-N-acetylglucosamine synthase-like glycosyltransferase